MTEKRGGHAAKETEGERDSDRLELLGFGFHRLNGVVV